MCCRRYREVDSLAPMISRPAELSRNSARAFCISPSRFSKRRAYSSYDSARIGQHRRSARSVDQLFADVGFQTLDRQRDRWLRAQHLFGGAGEALLVATARNTFSG